MSTRARSALDREQITDIENYGVEILDSPLETIETLGGGSARCMLLENFLDPR